MTKKLVNKALLISAFLALAACGNGGGGSDLASIDQGLNNPSDSSEVLADDTTDEQAFNANEQSENDAPETMVSEQATSSSRAAILKNYDHVDPNNVIRTSALENAMIYFHNNKSKIKNRKYVSVIDFSKSSAKARFHIINMDTGKVWSIRVAHGKGSDANHDGYAEKFSNTPGSKASSLGYYLTGSTYSGGNGLSLKLDGLSSTNSNARGRAVVIHGASYVKEKSVIQGRSWGCPAVAMENRTKVINLLKGGSLIYAVK